MPDQNEMEAFIRDAFETNYEMLRAEGAGALSPHTRANALRQVLIYWRKMHDVAEHVTDTEVRLSLPGQETPQGREFGIEGIVDIVQDQDRTVMYDIKTHDADEVRAHREDYEKQLNVYAHIWQTLRNQPLDQAAVIATSYPESVRVALNAADDEMLNLALQHWDPLVPIPFDQRTVHNTIRAFGEIVDAIEEEFAPPPVEVLRERLPGTRWRFATRVCRNCDGRYSCASYRAYAWPSGRAVAEANMSQFYGDATGDPEQEDWRSASLEASPDVTDLQADLEGDQMIQVEWQNDDRAGRPDKYTLQWDDNKGRLGAFLGGWTDWTRNNRHRTDVVHWRTMGALYASTFGSRQAAEKVPVVVRCELYHVALIAFINSRWVADYWSDVQREEALRLSWEEVERRGGSMVR